MLKTVLFSFFITLNLYAKEQCDLNDEVAQSIIANFENFKESATRWWDSPVPCRNNTTHEYRGCPDYLKQKLGDNNSTDEWYQCNPLANPTEKISNWWQGSFKISNPNSYCKGQFPAPKLLGDNVIFNGAPEVQENIHKSLGGKIKKEIGLDFNPKDIKKCLQGVDPNAGMLALSQTYLEAYKYGKFNREALETLYHHDAILGKPSSEILKDVCSKEDLVGMPEKEVKLCKKLGMCSQNLKEQTLGGLKKHMEERQKSLNAIRAVSMSVPASKAACGLKDKQKKKVKSRSWNPFTRFFNQTLGPTNDYIQKSRVAGPDKRTQIQMLASVDMNKLQKQHPGYKSGLGLLKKIKTGKPISREVEKEIQSFYEKFLVTKGKGVSDKDQINFKNWFELNYGDALSCNRYMATGEDGSADPALRTKAMNQLMEAQASYVTTKAQGEGAMPWINRKEFKSKIQKDGKQLDVDDLLLSSKLDDVDLEGAMKNHFEAERARVASRLCMSRNILERDFLSGTGNRKCHNHLNVLSRNLPGFVRPQTTENDFKAEVPDVNPLSLDDPDQKTGENLHAWMFAQAGMCAKKNKETNDKINQKSFELGIDVGLTIASAGVGVLAAEAKAGLQIKELTTAAEIRSAVSVASSYNHFTKAHIAYGIATGAKGLATTMRDMVNTCYPSEKDEVKKVISGKGGDGPKCSKPGYLKFQYNKAYGKGCSTSFLVSKSISATLGIYGLKQNVASFRNTSGLTEELKQKQAELIRLSKGVPRGESWEGLSQADNLNIANFHKKAEEYNEALAAFEASKKAGEDARMVLGQTGDVFEVIDEIKQKGATSETVGKALQKANGIVTDHIKAGL
ncbi:MAG: hypothetical protein KC493_13980 [Bacteriovoracaceae bacterium]|nr:hypothetical protein [Bacteriovoracaceae bacterium]